MNAALKVPPPPGCDHCADSSGFITSRKLGRVRCPYCRPAAVERVSRKEMRQLLTAVEARHREQAAISATVVVDDFKFPDVPAHLLTTKRVLDRWGFDGSGLAVDYSDDFRVAKPPPLDPATYTEVERIINRAPKRIRRFIYAYWRAPNSAYALRHWSRRQQGRIRLDCLHDMKARFLASKHRDLVALIQFIPE